MTNDEEDILDNFPARFGNSWRVPLLLLGVPVRIGKKKLVCACEDLIKHSSSILNQPFLSFFVDLDFTAYDERRNGKNYGAFASLKC